MPAPVRAGMAQQKGRWCLKGKKALGGGVGNKDTLRDRGGPSVPVGGR